MIDDLERNMKKALESNALKDSTNFTQVADLEDQAKTKCGEELVKFCTEHLKSKQPQTQTYSHTLRYTPAEEKQAWHAILTTICTSDYASPDKLATITGQCTSTVGSGFHINVMSHVKITELTSSNSHLFQEGVIA